MMPQLFVSTFITSVRVKRGAREGQCTDRAGHGNHRGSQQDKIKFQDQLFTKFQDNFRTFFDHKQLNTHSKRTLYSFRIFLPNE